MFLMTESMNLEHKTEEKFLMVAELYQILQQKMKPYQKKQKYY